MAMPPFHIDSVFDYQGLTRNKRYFQAHHSYDAGVCDAASSDMEFIGLC